MTKPLGRHAVTVGNLRTHHGGRGGGARLDGWPFIRGPHRTFLGHVTRSTAGGSMGSDEIGAALLVGMAVLLGTGLLRLAAEGTFQPAWYWVIAAAAIRLVTPAIRRRLDRHDP